MWVGDATGALPSNGDAVKAGLNRSILDVVCGAARKTSVQSAGAWCGALVYPRPQSQADQALPPMWRHDLVDIARSSMYVRLGCISNAMKTHENSIESAEKIKLSSDRNWPAITRFPEKPRPSRLADFDVSSAKFSFDPLSRFLLLLWTE